MSEFDRLDLENDDYGNRQVLTVRTLHNVRYLQRFERTMNDAALVKALRELADKIEGHVPCEGCGDGKDCSYWTGAERGCSKNVA